MAEQTDVYAGLIEVELKTERERKTSIDTRAASLVTTSGSLATILAAVGTFAGGRDGSSFPRHATPLLVLALVAFVLAALAGISASWGRLHDVTDVAPMKMMLRERWDDDERQARREVADVNVRMIERLRKVNQERMRFLLAGWVCQVIALILLAAVVLVLLATR